ncbi:hypothetical protein [uncultured Tateyamaria sp.]|uniref:hypothetical protein n=1 Tax=uncultured Tateyamaria sp. TaxID=455651 RepID=UPI002632E105|nr:hypothetical protein [uncultured Tateyamaria sp.]
MSRIDNYAIVLADVSFEALMASTYDTIIIESGVLGLDADGDIIQSPGNFITADQIAQLRAEGRTVMAYLNVAVTDHGRSYWNDDWVDPGFLPNFDPNGTLVVNDGPDRGGDFGARTGVAGTPAWLSGALGVASNFGYIVDWTDPAWVQRLEAEAAALVALGYDGLFLDDVGRYATHRFEAQPLPYGLDPVTIADLAAQARSMMQTVLDITAAVPDAQIVTNGGVDIAAHAALDANASAAALFAAYVAATDGLLMEAQYLDNPPGDDPAWIRAINAFGTDYDFLALEHSLTPDQWADFRQWALDLGIAGTLTDGNAYNTLPIPDPGNDAPADNSGNDLITLTRAGQTVQAGAGEDTVTGTAGADSIYGGAGADSLSGMDGNDLIFGDWDADVFALVPGQHAGDTIHGGDGDDTIYGSAGDDLIFAGAGNDVIYGGGGNDTIIGGTGRDTIFGGDGDDVLAGGAGGDRLHGDAGNDSLYGHDLPDTFLFDI